MARPLICDLTSLISKTNCRCFSTTSVCNGKRNFRKFPLYNFRGTRQFKESQEKNPDPDIPIHTYGVRQPGYKRNNKFHLVPEMIPELIVPDLTNCPLKPYVSYKASEVVQSEFTARDLFDAIYRDKIQSDFLEGKLDENGNPIQPNAYEKLTSEEALLKARQTGEREKEIANYKKCSPKALAVGNLDEIDDRSVLPFPKTTAGEVGWLASKKEFKLEIYGGYVETRKPPQPPDASSSLFYSTSEG